MKSVLITGATSGIGLSLCHAYLADDWNVIACGRSHEALQKLSNMGAKTLAFDVTEADTLNAVLADLPALDLAILNAGHCEYIDDVMAFDTGLFKRVMEVNVQGVVNLLPFILPALQQHAGRLALMSSSVGYAALPRAQAYGASKAAIDYMAGSLALDLKNHGISVSTIRPGFVDTPLTQKNTFSMPMKITAEQAAKLIIKGLSRGQTVIAFPKRFIWMLRLFNWLPFNLRHKLLTKNA